jgi:hypothetical protein
VLSESQFAHLRQSGAVVQSNFAHRGRVDFSRLVLTYAEERSDFGERPLNFAVNLSGFILFHASTIRVSPCFAFVFEKQKSEIDPVLVWPSVFRVGGCIYFRIRPIGGRGLISNDRGAATDLLPLTAFRSEKKIGGKWDRS